jgi:polar amino acid transport system substrate-binding protein
MRYLLILAIVFSLLGVCQAELRILGEVSPPGEYLDEDGNPAGATIELVRELLHRLDVRATIHILPWKRAYDMGLNENNVALMETTRTPEREKSFKWVGPILVVRRIIYGMHTYDAPLKTIADLRKGGTICVLRGSSNERYLQSLNITQINAVTVPAQCLKMLLADRVQLFYTSEIGMDGLLKEQGLSAGTVAALLDLKKEYLYLAFSMDVSDARIRRWQDALDAAKRDGTVARIYHGVYSPETIKDICQPGDPLAQ